MSRAPGSSFDPEKMAQRMADESARRDEAIIALVEGVTGRMDMFQKGLTSLQEEVRRGHLDRFKMESQISALEMQVIETREAVKLTINRETEAAAKGGAEGAAKGAGIAASMAAAETAKVTAAEVARGFWRTTMGKIVAVGTGIAALGAGVDNLPKVLTWASRRLPLFWDSEMTTDAATVRTIEHGEPSDIPSPSWIWRRWYVFALTALAMALIWRLTERVEDITTLRMVARYLCWTVGGLVFVYVAGATATDCVSMASVLRSTRKETISSGPPPATVTDGRVETPSADTGELPESERVRL